MHGKNKKMLSISARRPLDTWDKQNINPGPVGSLGDALVAMQLKSTFPGDYRESSYTKGNKELRLGSNVQDGDKKSWSTNGGQPRVVGGYFGGDRDALTTQRGIKFQNVKAEDMLAEPVCGSLPQFGWRSRKAQINNALTTGEKFKDLPGGYKPGPYDVPRGGSKPGVVNSDDRAPQYLAGNAKAFVSAQNPTIDYGTGQRDERIRRGIMEVLRGNRGPSVNLGGVGVRGR